MKRYFDGLVYCPYCGLCAVKTVMGDVCCGKFRCKDCGNCFTLSNDDVLDVKMLEVRDEN